MQSLAKSFFVVIGTKFVLICRRESERERERKRVKRNIRENRNTKKEEDDE